MKMVLLPDLLETMKREFKVVERADQHPEKTLQKVEVDNILGEMQDLLEAKQYQAAERKLTTLRARINARER